MKVILKEDMVNLGDKGAIVTVADGYARNYLIPQKLAVMATSGAVKAQETLLKGRLKKHQKEQESMQESAEKINTAKLVIKKEVGENDRIFGSITNIQIVTELKEQLGLDIDKKRVGLHHPIRAIGKYMIPIKVFTGVNAQLTLIVEDQDAEKKAKAKKPTAPPRKRVVKKTVEEDDTTESKPKAKKPAAPAEA